jgi:hypothetical protein
MAHALKTELLVVLKSSGQLAQHVEWNDADRALLRRWVDDWTNDPEHASLWKIIETDARKLGVQSATVLIFQDLIFYTVTAWQIAKGAESGDDPIKQEREKRQEELLELSRGADALAKYYRDNTDLLDNQELLMSVLKGAEIRLSRPVIEPTSPPPVYSFRIFQNQLPDLYERQADVLRRRVKRESSSTTFISRKSECRVLNAFVHKITEFLGDLCGTQADGKPHRKIIAMLANICFPDEIVDHEDVRKMLKDRRAKGSARQR